MTAAQTQAMEAVRAADRDRYLSVLYAPEDKRPALFALYAFNAEIASVRDRIREALPGEIRLQWWRDAIAKGEAGGHPLAEALLAAISRHGLPKNRSTTISRRASSTSTTTRCRAAPSSKAIAARLRRR